MLLSPPIAVAKSLPTLLMLAALSACTSSVVKPEAPAIDPPRSFTAVIESAPTRSPWWDEALPESLQQRVQAVLIDNPQIRISAQQVEIDRARLQGAEAERWLDIGAGAGSGVQRVDGNDDVSHSAGLEASLPLDLFGRLALSRDAAAYDLAQSLAALEQQRLQQVQAYLLSLIDREEANQLQQLLSEQLDTVQTLLRLTELRFAQGLVSSVDVLQQREQLAALHQQIPAVKLRRRIAANQLAELRGATPPMQVAGTGQLPAIAARFADASPAALLQRRPDLVGQRAALAASDSRYEAALRERLPEASLSASALLRMLAGDPSAVLGAAVDASVSVFDSGRLSAGIAEQRAQLQQAGLSYLQNWLQAVRETDDLANRLVASREQIKRSQQVSEAAGELFEATRRRYERGISDYLPVLGALRSLQQQQRDHLALQAEQLRITVRLHTALGLPRATPAPGEPG